MLFPPLFPLSPGSDPSASLKGSTALESALETPALHKPRAGSGTVTGLALASRQPCKQVRMKGPFSRGGRGGAAPQPKQCQPPSPLKWAEQYPLEDTSTRKLRAALLGRRSLQMEVNEGSGDAVVLDEGGPESNDWRPYRGRGPLYQRRWPREDGVLEQCGSFSIKLL